MQDFKVILPEPQEFEIKHFMDAMGKLAEDFLPHRNGNTICITHNDAFGLYRQNNTFLSGNASDRLNLLEYMKFELDDQGRLVAIAPGHPLIPYDDILFKLWAAGTRTGNKIYDLMVDYINLMGDQKKKVVDAAVAGNPAQYSHQMPEADAIIAGVFQRKYATAQGPVVGVNYIGTYGIGPCVGVAVVTKVHGEEHPLVSLAHIDEYTDLDASIPSLMNVNGHTQGKTTVTLVSGQRSDEDLIKVKEAFAKYGIEAQFDVASSGSKTLIVDLRTGSVVEPTPFRSAAAWLQPDASLLDAMLRLMTLSASKCLLKKEYDLRKGKLPDSYEITRDTSSRYPALVP